MRKRKTDRDDDARYAINYDHPDCPFIQSGSRKEREIIKAWARRILEEEAQEAGKEFSRE